MIARLKSLELQGYKTFANRTVFEFPGAVTAIVGPNGSGKSNITDALRWVLGEQSYSLLRGKKTEDMIFSGSDRRTRSGMASATVILDNSDSWLPIDFSEVAIARRAYRDGSNEYMLNGQRVRLKDVSELLAESGLAERTYTIIGQGLVDAALALRAEDRRRLFEEAAGIGLHRSRRQEAVRRLADTQRNLERVQDIIAELRPRLRSLEKQARRAQEYEHAVADLHSLLHEWYGYHWYKAQEDLSDAQSQVKEFSGELEQNRQRESEITQEITKLREERQIIRENINRFNLHLAKLHTRRESISRELAVAEERERFLIEQETRYESERVQLTEELITLEERKKFAEQDASRLAIELEEAKANEISSREGLDNRQHERGKIEEQIAQEKQNLVEISAHRTEIQHRRLELLSIIEDLDKAILKSESLIVKHQSQFRQIGDAIEASKQELAVAESAMEKIDAEKIELDQKISELSIQRENISKQLATDETDLSKKSAQFEVIKQAEKTHLGYSSGIKLLLDAIDKVELKAESEVLGSMLTVQEKYEIAVGAVLGEFSEALVVTDNKQVENALVVLDRNPENAVIIPLENLIQHEEAPFPKGEGIEGPLRNFVSVPERLKLAIDLLVGNTLVVNNRETARKIMPAMRTMVALKTFPEPKLVTLSGEVFHIYGPVKTTAGTKPVSISRQRERRNIQDAISTIEGQLEKTRSDAAEIEAKRSALDTQIAKVVLSYQAQREEYERTQNAHRQLIINYEHAKREMSWQEEQLVQQKSSLEKTLLQIQSVDDEISSLDDREATLNTSLRILKDSIGNLPIENFQGDLAHWTTRVAVLEQAFRESRNRLEERQQDIDESAKKISLVDESIVRLKEEQALLMQEIERLRTESVDIAGEIDDSMKLISPAEGELDSIESKMSRYLSLESEERVISNQAESKFTQARISQVRKQEALDRLRRQIELDFGLVAFEYREDVSGPSPLPLDGFVKDLPLRTELSRETEEALKNQRALVRRIGPINPEALKEYQEVEERYTFLTSQVEDLKEAAADVERVIEELDEIMQREFCNTFEAVAEEFHQIFNRLFGGGTARLILTDPDDLTETGIDIEARLPGKREQGLSLLSGGERSLTAVALVFSLLRVSPTPFCVLDEVDAMLDEANVGRFRELLRELSRSTQFILITHNRATVQVADIIYGVTMGKDSTSQILSLKIDELEKVV